jgi:hypothetical protein
MRSESQKHNELTRIDGPSQDQVVETKSTLVRVRNVKILIQEVMK